MGLEITRKILAKVGPSTENLAFAQNKPRGTKVSFLFYKNMMLNSTKFNN
jgi:hypothetical protein